jgi:SAM-dependent methyltransferase
MTSAQSLDGERNAMYDRSKLQTIEDFKKLIDSATVADAPHQKAELLKNLPDISAFDMDSIAVLLRLLIQKQFPAFSIGLYGTTESAVDEAVYDQEFYEDEYGYSNRSSRIIVPLLLELVQPRCVVDVGCGVGAWVSAFKKKGLEDVLGIDGEWVEMSMLCIPEEQFMRWDLKKPIKLDTQFDLAISLEVAEHLPAECADSFVASLCRLAPVVCFSAAIPFSGGNGHVNEQWPHYWIERFMQNGYECIDCIRPRIWINDEVEPCYAQNMFLFCSPEGIKNNAQLKKAHNIQKLIGMPHAYVHPKIFMALIYNGLLGGAGLEPTLFY